MAVPKTRRPRAPHPLVRNEELARAFEEIADLLALQDANPFRVRAYQRAALTIRALPQELHDSVAAGFDPDTLPAVGADLAGKIREMLASGRLRALEALRRAAPPGQRELLRLPGLGPRRVAALQQTLRVTNVKQLRRAIAQHRLVKAAGLGAALEQRLARALDARERSIGRELRPEVAPRAAALEQHLRRHMPDASVTTAGSFRRGRDTVGDIDVLVCSHSNVELGRLLTKFDQTEELLAGGATSARARLRGGLQLDVRRVAPESCGAALVYFTGSKAHNVRIRTQARSLGLRINEYGVFRGRKRIAGETEQSVYAALGLPWIPPELREDEGEIEAARQHRLPVLLERADLRGDLHVHTLASDGRASVAQMAKAAQKAGLKYLAIADHGRHLGIVHGLDAEDLARQIEQIERYNTSGPAVTLLKAAEVDILDDGSLCLPDAILGRLDLVIAAVHTGLGKTARQQTSRLLRALDNRYLSVLAHPTGRLMPDRPPMQADWATIFRRAAQRPCYLEINAQPARLDLDDTMARAAAESGALLSVASDAHDVGELALLGGGVMQARRAWITRERVINTRGLGELRPLLRATMR